MTIKGQLKEIKKHLENTVVRLGRSNGKTQFLNDLKWLLEQAEKVETYEKELDRLWTERYKDYAISKDREYVLVSVKWTRDGYLVFWGTQTKDDEKRSYSGYTMDLETCEKYTFDEAVNQHHQEWKGQKFWELKKEDRDGTVAVKIKDLHNFGSRKTIIWM